MKAFAIILIFVATSLSPLPMLSVNAFAGPEEDYLAGLAAFQKKDFATAYKVWKPMAEQGYAVPQYFVATMYESGFGVTQSYSDAAKYYRKAADQEVNDAQSNLGILYLEGKGVPQSDTDAFFWIQKAANAEVAKAQYNLGTFYYNGTGVSEDHDVAIIWFKKAATEGFQDAKDVLKQLGVQ